MTNPTYRFAGPGDVEALVQLRLDFLAEGAHDPRAVAALEESFRVYFTEMIPAGAFVAALAETDGRIVGVSGMVIDRHPPLPKNPTGLNPYILNVYVRPAFRRQGIALSLLQMLVEKARSAGAKIICLHFWPGRSELYAKLGFVPRANEMKLEL